MGSEMCIRDSMYSGSVVVGGNSGAIPGVAIRGAEIVIRGNMGSRAGQVMKAGTLCCAGNANFMAGYMMYGGRIIIVGDSGERVGEDMSAGEIFVGGQVQDLGSDAMIVDTESGEDEEIRAFLDRYEISFSGSFTKVINAGKKLRYGSTEEQMRSLPFTVFPVSLNTGIARCRRTSISSPTADVTGSEVMAVHDRYRSCLIWHFAGTFQPPEMWLTL